MPYRGLTEFVESLADAGQLARIAVEVDARCELAQVTARVATRQGPVLVFAQVAGCRWPVVSNLLGTPERMLRALGADSDAEVIRRLESQLEASVPEGWFERLRMGESGGRRFAPKLVKTAPCQQVVRLGSDIALAELPALADALGRPQLTGGIVYWAADEAGTHPSVQTAVTPLDGGRLAVACSPLDPLGRRLQASSTPLPAAIGFGGDPAVLVASLALLADGIEPLWLAGVLRDKPMELIRARSVELEVPADAEVVLEGALEPGDIAATGAATFRISAMTHRANPVVPVLVRHGGNDEVAVAMRLLSRAFLPVMRRWVPELVDFDLPASTGCRRLAVASVRTSYPGHASRIAGALWALPVFRFARTLILVDPSVDVRDAAAVLGALGNRPDPAADTIGQIGPPDPLDGPCDRAAAYWLCDAISRSPGRQTQANDDAAARVAARWAEYGLEL